MEISIVAVCFVLLVSPSVGWLFSSSVCYNDPPVGCFPNHGPYRNTGGFRPESPASVRVRFIHHTQDGGLRFTLNQTQEAMASRFDPDLGTVMLIHGYFESGAAAWISRMLQHFTTMGSLNVFVVDWEQGAHSVFYHQSAANTKMAGAISALFLQELVALGASPSSMHLIGLSLGAHVAGETGRRFPGLGRITGLDPAAPCFEGHDPVVRLDATDAVFVDVVHTDVGDGDLLTGGRGMTTPCGTVDFYPNGGTSQPGCEISLMGSLSLLWSQSHTSIEALKFLLGCNHIRSTKLFESTLSHDCDYQMSRCSNPNQAEADSCTLCADGECPDFGYDMNDLTGSPTGIFRFSTSGDSPYC